MVRVGILHSLTGSMAISERSLVDAVLMAIAEINEAGGVLGQIIEPVIEDGTSESQEFVRKAEKLLQRDQVVTMFGCWTSASRKAIVPLVEAANILLWYPVQYEGLEASKNVFYFGCCPNQQVEPAVAWLLRHHGDRFYLLGSNYVFPRTVHKMIHAQLQQAGGTVVGEAYVPLGNKAFELILQEILQAKPDVIFNTLNGDSNLAFYRAYREAGCAPETLPVMAVSAAEPELQSMAIDAAGTYASWSYFQSLPGTQNQQFVTAFRAKYGHDRVTSDPIAAAYSQVHAWKQAVETAQSFATAAVRQAAYGQLLETPGGQIQIERNHHVQKSCLIGKVLTSGQFEVVYQSDRPIPPLPWLGVEHFTDIPNQTLVIDLLAEGVQSNHYLCELEQQSHTLEATLAQLQQETQERQQAEAELRTMFTAMDDFVSIFDQQGRYLKILSTDSSLYNPDLERIGKTVDEILPPEQAALHLSCIQQALRTQQTVSLDYHLMMGDEQRRYSAKVSPLSDTTAIWVARDISDLERATLELQQTEARNRALLEVIPDLIMRINRKGTYLDFVPPTNFTMIGKEDLIGKSEYEVMPPEISHQRMHYIHKALDTRELQVFEYSLNIDGTLSHEEARIIPCGPDEVLVIVRDISDRKRMEAERNQAEAALALAHAEILALNEQLKAENLRMSAELEVSRRLQQMVLPKQSELNAIDQLDIAGFMEPADEVGGDYYDVLQQNGRIQIGIGDVTGHGLESGVVMLMVQASVRALIANGETDRTKLLNTINRIIYDNTKRMRSPRNMTLAILEYESGVLRLTGQHEELIIVRKNGDIEKIDTLELGFPLGLELDITRFIAEKKVFLNSDDVAVLYTDGITEAMNLSKEQYGLERLYQVIQQYRDCASEVIRKAIIKDLMTHIGEQKVFDDITVVVLKQK